MRVSRIALSGFRNYEWESFTFDPGTNVIRGKNGQGKTNLLEAVFMLTGGKSFRTRFDREIVGFGFSSAEILADVEAAGREQTVKITLAPGQRKQILVNSVKKSASELAGTMTAVLFSPDDLALVREGAAVRRRLMDTAISQLRPGYAAALSDFNRLYEQKSAILRDWREKPSLLDTLDDFSERLCRLSARPAAPANLSARLTRYRAAFSQRLAEAAAPINRDFSGGADELTMSYKPVSSVENPFASEREIYYAICDHQEKHREAELASGQCLTGAHKDDLELMINGKSARTFASQGQTRTAALSLKLASREIFYQETGEWPVLLLDDVLSELDEGRKQYLLTRMKEKQTFVTSCDDTDFLKTDGEVYRMDGGVLNRV